MRAMAGHRGSFRSQLLELARVYDIQTAYTDFWGQRRRAEPEALLAVLRGLGAGVETLRDVPDALRERRQERWRRVCPQVCVAWQGAAPALELRLPADLQETTRLRTVSAWRTDGSDPEASGWAIWPWSDTRRSRAGAMV